MRKPLVTLMGVAALAATLSVAPAGAQNGPPDPGQMIDMRIERMNENLKLSKDQQKKIKSLYMDAQKANMEVMGGMREANQSIAAAVKNNDANAMSQAANMIGNLTAQMTVNNAKAEAAVWAVLTPEQQAKYQPMVGGMGGMGRGMGMGPGGGRRGGPPQE